MFIVLLNLPPVISGLEREIIFFLKMFFRQNNVIKGAYYEAAPFQVILLLLV